MKHMLKWILYWISNAEERYSEKDRNEHAGFWLSKFLGARNIKLLPVSSHEEIDKPGELLPSSIRPIHAAVWCITTLHRH